MKGLFAVLALTIGAIALFLVASALNTAPRRSPKHPDPYLHKGKEVSMIHL